MHIDFLLDVFRENQEKESVIWKDEAYTYEWLLKRIDHWGSVADEKSLAPGTITAIEAAFSPNSIALFLALISRGCILVPLTSSVETKKKEFMEIAQCEAVFRLDKMDEAEFHLTGIKANHHIYGVLKERNHPGLVLFSSGSTGKSKAAVHDLTGILSKFKVRRHSFRSITFLLYDHIGGVNTLLYNLSNAGCVITVRDRSPDHVLSAIQMHKAELLPTSPTFINLVLLSEAFERFDLDSLKIVTYGTEPMPESTLKRFHSFFPEIRLLQTYGLSEVGILRSKSRSSDSLWVKVGGEGFETRIVDGILHIKAESAMLGYLNAESPFTEDGWFITGDLVEQDGEYLRFMGRKSEIINVGGEKVYPAEVESVIHELTNVAEVTVSGEANPIMGNIVCALIRLKEKEDKKEFTRRLKKHCNERLQRYKVPVKIKIDTELQHSERFKKIRFREKA